MSDDNPRVIVYAGSKTPPPSEKVGDWILKMHDDPATDPPRPPRSESEWNTPAFDERDYEHPTMDNFKDLGPTRMQQRAPSPVAPVARVPSRVPSRQPSPVRSTHTARAPSHHAPANDSMTSLPDYLKQIAKEEEAKKAKSPSVHPDRNLASPNKPGDRHLSYESWGNLDATKFRRDTLQSNEPFVGGFRRPGETPAFAAGIPLPAMSEHPSHQTQSQSEDTDATPSIVPITVQTPSHAPSRAPSYHQQVESAYGKQDTPPRTPTRAPSRAPSKAPSIAQSPHQTERSRIQSPERSIQAPFSPPKSTRSRAPTDPQRDYLGYGKSPAAFALPPSELGGSGWGSPPHTQSRPPTQAPLSPRPPTFNRSVAGSRQSHQHQPSVRSVAESEESNDLESLETEHSALPSRLGSYFGASQKAPSHVAKTPAKSSVALHPLTNLARSQAASSVHPGSPPQITAEDRAHAAIRGRSVAPSNASYQQSVVESNGPSYHHHEELERHASRPESPFEELNPSERRLLEEQGLLRTPRTSYTIAPSALAAEVQESHFHDNELCLLLHAADDPDAHELVRSAVRKAVKQRLKRLGLKHDRESVQRYRHSYYSIHDGHDMKEPLHDREEPPPWAREMMAMVQKTIDNVQQTVETTNAKLERLDNRMSVKSSIADSREDDREPSHHADDHLDTDHDEYTETQRSPETVTVPIHGNGSARSHSWHPEQTDGVSTRPPSHAGHTATGSVHHHDGSRRMIDDEEDEESLSDHSNDSHGRRRGSRYTPPHQDSEAASRNGVESRTSKHGSHGQQYLEEEIYRLRTKPTKSEHSHQTWEIARDRTGTVPKDDDVTDADGMPEIPDGDQTSGYGEEIARRESSPALKTVSGAVVRDSQGWEEWHPDSDTPPPWQRIHQRLLGWAMVWTMSELDQALNSTLRGHQVNEVALSIWVTQTYKRYVRSRLMDHPRQTVDRLFVPPNVADAINNAVFNGRHGDACGMLKDLWHPFGLEGMPRIIVVLARHRKDENHWVVHKFSLPDGGLTTFDSFPERALPDGRPLGWWFAIRIAWPHAMYPSPDHLVQKIVRLHRPLQLLIDNSVAAAGVWRNILMGSRAERSVDLERLRDLINTEIKNLRQRKELGKLTVTSRPNWELMQAT